MGTVSIYPTSNAYVVSFSARKVYIPCGATLKFVDSLPNEEKKRYSVKHSFTVMLSIEAAVPTYV